MSLLVASTAPAPEKAPLLTVCLAHPLSSKTFPPQLGFALVIPEATRKLGRCSTCVGATLLSQPTDCRAWAANPTCCQSNPGVNGTNVTSWQPVNDARYLLNVLSAVQGNFTVRARRRSPPPPLLPAAPSTPCDLCAAIIITAILTLRS